MLFAYMCVIPLLDSTVPLGHGRLEVAKNLKEVDRLYWLSSVCQGIRHCSSLKLLHESCLTPGPYITRTSPQKYRFLPCSWLWSTLEKEGNMSSLTVEMELQSGIWEFWDVTSCRLVKSYRRFGRLCYLSFRCQAKILFDFVTLNTTILQNCGYVLPSHKAQDLRRIESSATPLWVLPFCKAVVLNLISYIALLIYIRKDYIICHLQINKPINEPL
jgi:hypothetical protein